MALGQSLVPLLHGVNIFHVLVLLDAAALTLARERLIVDHLRWEQVLLVVDFRFFTWFFNHACVCVLNIRNLVAQVFQRLYLVWQLCVQVFLFIEFFLEVIEYVAA